MDLKRPDSSGPGFSLGIFPVPRSLGMYVLLVGIVALIGGSLRHELALTLTGTVFFAILAYSFIAPVILLLLYHGEARTLTTRIIPGRISAGKTGGRNSAGIDFQFSRRGGRGRFIRLPGILIRYELSLSTVDGRQIRHVLDPRSTGRPAAGQRSGPRSIEKSGEGAEFFPAPPRGAYYGPADDFVIRDVLGLFRLALPIPQEKGPRLLALPEAAELPPARIRTGGNEQRTEAPRLRTDNLIEHRPYVPGDDPRRINWKLYGHAGDLFVRDEEREPPPHAKLLILVDTQIDPALYGAEAGRRGVDLLCEYALGAALEYGGRGMDIRVGYTGGGIRDGNAPDIAAALAYPAALPLAGGEELPQNGADQGILLLALPRSGVPGFYALDRFLKNLRRGQSLDLIFLYEGEKPEEAAETCVACYRRGGGIDARRFRI